MGGIDEGSELYATVGGEEWVSGCGYLTGTFVNDWLGIPATGRKTNIWFGLFYVMREGKIAESYVQLGCSGSDAAGGVFRYCRRLLARKAARFPDPSPKTGSS